MPVLVPDSFGQGLFQVVSVCSKNSSSVSVAQFYSVVVYAFRQIRFDVPFGMHFTSKLLDSLLFGITAIASGSEVEGDVCIGFC